MVDEKKVTGYALTVLQDPTEPNLIFDTPSLENFSWRLLSFVITYL